MCTSRLGEHIYGVWGVRLRGSWEMRLELRRSPVDCEISESSSGVPRKIARFQISALAFLGRLRNFRSQLWRSPADCGISEFSSGFPRQICEISEFSSGVPR